MVTENECKQSLRNLENINLDVVLDELGYEKAEEVSIYGINDYPTLEKLGDINILRELINEHFSNPPLKIDELEEGMVIWDNKEKIWIELYSVHKYEGGDEDENYDYEIFYYKFGWECLGRLFYEPNRFYRKEVINHDN